MRSIKQRQQIDLFINPEVMNKMKLLVDTCNKEVGWHGLVERIDVDVFYWYDIIMYPQYVTGASVTPDEEEYTNWLMAQFEREDFENIRFHGHSHVNMATTPSGVDMGFREDIIASLKDEDYYIFLITNKKEDMHIEIYDKYTETIYETKDIEITVGQPDEALKNIEWTRDALKEVKEKCSTTKKVESSSTHQYSTPGYRWWEQEQSEELYSNYWRDLESRM